MKRDFHAVSLEETLGTDCIDLTLVHAHGTGRTFGTFRTLSGLSWSLVATPGGPGLATARAGSPAGPDGPADTLVAHWRLSAMVLEAWCSVVSPHGKPF